MMEDVKENVKCNALVMFSGGYDSVALLHKLILSEDFDKIIVVFENSEQIVSEFEVKNAKKIFNLFNRRYSSKYNVDLIWEEEHVNIGWAKGDYPYDNYNQDILLLLHLTTILRHGEVNNFYLGWEKHAFEHLDISKKLLNWFKKHAISDYQIFFLDNYFNSRDLAHSKSMVVEYLLENDLFHLPYSSETFESIKEYESRKYWYKNNAKENSVAKALIGINLFESEDISKIFIMKTTKEIQEYYNEKRKEHYNQSKESA
jgi:hypothetical protein